MPTRRAALGLLATAPAAAMLATPARADEPPVFAIGGIAIRGADPVACFELPEDVDAVIGDPAHAFDWMGATWHFASAANRDTFAADPAAYAPAFGGYCAFAAARGYVAPTVPEAWSVIDGRLFLNFSLRIRRRWLGDLPQAIARGDANWPAILG
jgi:YHS domain-containing protein